MADTVSLDHLCERITGLQMLSKSEIIDSAKPQKTIAGIYFLIAGDNVCYVGQSADIQRRVAMHRQLKRRAFDRFSYVECDPKHFDVLESLYIHALRPTLQGRIGNTVRFMAKFNLGNLVDIAEGDA